MLKRLNQTTRPKAGALATEAGDEVSDYLRSILHLPRRHSGPTISWARRASALQNAADAVLHRG